MGESTKFQIWATGAAGSQTFSTILVEVGKSPLPRHGLPVHEFVVEFDGELAVVVARIAHRAFNAACAFTRELAVGP